MNKKKPKITAPGIWGANDPDRGNTKVYTDPLSYCSVYLVDKKQW